MPCLDKFKFLYFIVWIVAVNGFLSLSLPVEARPKIGLVLGGGGAKGAAHVGVLEVLEQQRIPIDYISGTSIGSVVAGMYATGITVDEIKRIMLETNWAEGYSDKIPRENLPWRVKQQYDRFNFPLEVGLDNGHLKIPGGLLYGQSVTKLLRNTLGELPNFKSFDDLVIPYRAVATDLVSYKAIVIDKGNLIAAMRASSSVPGVLAPEYLDNLLLVDGGITKNLPIDVVLSMGADIVIAVDIGTGLQPKEALKSSFDVISQLTNFLTNNNVVYQKELLSSTDILIAPNIEGLSTTDWETANEAFERGKIAASKHADKLFSLSLDVESYQLYLLEIQKRRNEILAEADKPIAQIHLNKATLVADKLIINRLGLNSGDRATNDEINEAVDRLFSIDKFQRVDAFTVINDGEKTLHIVAEDKSWGPNFLQFGIGWEDDLENNSNLNFDIAYIMSDLTTNGGEWRSELEIGTRRSLATELYLPLDGKRDFYSSSRYSFDAFQWDIFVEDLSFIPIDQQFHSLSQGVGYNYTQPGFIETGITADVGEFRDPIYLQGAVDYLTYGGYLKFGFDNLDSIDFPTEGLYFNLDSFLRYEKVDDHSIISRSNDDEIISSLVLDVNLKGALKFGNHAVVAKLAYSDVFTQKGNESVYISYLGGFLNLSGYQKNSLAGAKKIFSAGVYQFDLGRSFISLDQYPLYLGISFETGNVWQEGNEISLKDLVVSNSVYIGTNIALGPIALGYGRSNADIETFYFYLGKNF